MMRDVRALSNRLSTEHIDPKKIRTGNLDLD
jgi:hypothetical protein